MGLQSMTIPSGQTFTVDANVHPDTTYDLNMTLMHTMSYAGEWNADAIAWFTPVGYLPNTATIYSARAYWYLYSEQYYGAYRSVPINPLIYSRLNVDQSWRTWNTINQRSATYLGEIWHTQPSWRDIDVTNQLAFCTIFQVPFILEISYDQYGWEIGFAGQGWGGANPYLSVTFGYVPTNVVGSNLTPRKIALAWTPAAGADRYRIQYWQLVGGVPTGDPVTEYVTGASNWMSTASLASGTSWRVSVSSEYYVAGNYWNAGVGGTADITVTAATPNVPIAVGDTPIRKKVRITTPGSLYGSTSWDFQVRKLDETVVWNADHVTDSYYDADCMAQPAGAYRVYQRARYDDDDVSNWSALTLVSITQPTITNLWASGNLYRQLTASWDVISDAHEYTCELKNADGSVVQQTVTVYQPEGTQTASVNFTSVRGGNHQVTVTPVYTNGYTGAVTPATVTGGAIIPQPFAPSGVGDTPLKRQLTAAAPPTGGSYLPSAFYGAQSWDFILDNDESTVINTTSGIVTFSAVRQGQHVVTVRARWADGDVSLPSGPSSYITTTSPPITDLWTRHTGAPTSIASTSFQAGTGLSLIDVYFVAVSVNYNGNRTTETVNGLTRAINESCPSVLQSAGLQCESGMQTIRVSKPANCTGSNSWNVYCGTSKDLMKLQTSNLSSGTSTYDITSFTPPANNESRAGQADLTWVAPTGVGDNPTTYKVEAAKSNPFNSPGGSPDVYSDVTSISGTSGIYSSNKFFINGLETGYWFFRVSAVYSNDQSTPLETLVRT